MSDADHVRLAEFLASIEGMAMVNGYPCAMYERLYGGWRLVGRFAHAGGARDRVEGVLGYIRQRLRADGLANHFHLPS